MSQKVNEGFLKHPEIKSGRELTRSLKNVDLKIRTDKSTLPSVSQCALPITLFLSFVGFYFDWEESSRASYLSVTWG